MGSDVSGDLFPVRRVLQWTALPKIWHSMIALGLAAWDFHNIACALRAFSPKAGT